MKQKLRDRLSMIIIILLIYLVVTTMIQALKNPNLTNTELFIKIPKSLILDYEN